MLVIAGTIDIDPEDRDALIEAMKIVTGPSRAEPGCHHYGFSVDIEDANRFHLFEVWEDAAAVEQHFKSPHFRAYFERSGKLRISRTILRFQAEELPAGAGPKP